MRIEDIKNDCLKALGVTFYQGEGEEYRSEIEARRYESGLKNAILRAYDRMRTVGVVPMETVDLPEVEKEIDVAYDLDGLIGKGHFAGAYVEVENAEEMLSALVKGNKLKLFRRPSDGAYVKYVRELDVEEEETFLPDALCRLFPYFVKSELLMDEEPSLAIAARNLFEKSLEEYNSTPLNLKQKIVYKYQ